MQHQHRSSSNVVEEHTVSTPTRPVALAAAAVPAVWVVAAGAVLRHHSHQQQCSWAPALTPVLAWQLLALTCAAAAAVHHLLCRRVVAEAVRLLHGVGVVLESRSLLGGVVSAQFVEQASIAGPLINEGLTTTDVHYYLAFLLHGQDTLAVAFQALLPDLATILPVYRAAVAAHG